MLFTSEVDWVGGWVWLPAPSVSGCGVVVFASMGCCSSKPDVVDVSSTFKDLKREVTRQEKRGGQAQPALKQLYDAKGAVVAAMGKAPTDLARAAPAELRALQAAMQGARQTAQSAAAFGGVEARQLDELLQKVEAMAEHKESYAAGAKLPAEPSMELPELRAAAQAMRYIVSKGRKEDSSRALEVSCCGVVAFIVGVAYSRGGLW